MMMMMVMTMRRVMSCDGSIGAEKEKREGKGRGG